MGTFIKKVDKKQRVSVPFDFRNLLIKEDCHAVICFPSFTGECLEGGGTRYIEKLKTMIEAMDPYDEAREALEDATIGSCLRLAMDQDGRITLGEEFNQHANINSEVAFVGLGDKFQIWNPDDLKENRLKLRKIARENRAMLKSGALGLASGVGSGSANPDRSEKGGPS